MESLKIALTPPRDDHGRFLSRACPDPNCGGTFQPDRCGWWRCDGLTHDTDTGPLYACPREIPPPAIQASLNAA